MAKVCMIEREKKRIKTVKKHEAKRAELKAIIKNPNSSFEERMDAQSFARATSLPLDWSSTCGLSQVWPVP
jgi:small subunit ribosomal protein S14